MATQITSSSTFIPITHTVEVGKAGYTISPDIVLAEVGDYIEYQFFPRNHSIVQAEYEYPCVPYGLVNTRPGFASGFYPVDAVLDDPPTFTVRVNDTEPIFVYCSGPWACIDHGMVAVVNPNANVSLDHQRQLALQADFVLQPGDKWPEEGRPTTSTESFTTTSTTSSTSSTTSAAITAPAETSVVSTPAPTSSSTNHGLSTGAIAGIAIGGAALLLIAAMALWLCGRRSNRNNNRDTSGGWYLGSKKNGFESGATTPAMVPPAYNPHGVPFMTQAKGYPTAMPTTSVVEHYNFTPGHSPPPQIIPQYNQQAFQHQSMDAAAYSQNHGYPVVPGPGGPGYLPQHNDVAQHRPEMYGGTPAPPAQTTTMTPSGVGVSSAPSHERTSMSLSGNSRMGSPDHLAEMNAARSQAGTLNHGGGGFLLQPAPVRGVGAQSESHVKRFDA